MSAFERIVGIDRLIRERGGITASWAAERFSVSTRQIKRDIEYLRDRLDAPIVWDRHRGRYCYEQPFTALAFADERGLIALALLKNLLLNEHYVPIASQETLEMAAAWLPESYRRVADRIHYELPVSRKLDMAVFTDVVQAICDDRRLAIAYTDADGNHSERTVEPERVVNYSGRWYLVAYDLTRHALRTFHLSRIQSLAILREKADRPPERDEIVSRYIEDSYGIFKGTSTQRAEVRIHGPAAARVADQIWHPDQIITEATTDTGAPAIDIDLPIAQWPEILAKVLSFGSSAEAISPAEFREMWIAEVGRMVGRVRGKY